MDVCFPLSLINKTRTKENYTEKRGNVTTEHDSKMTATGVRYVRGVRDESRIGL